MSSDTEPDLSLHVCPIDSSNLSSLSGELELLSQRHALRGQVERKEIIAHLIKDMAQNRTAYLRDGQFVQPHPAARASLLPLLKAGEAVEHH